MESKVLWLTYQSWFKKIYPAPDVTGHLGARGTRTRVSHDRAQHAREELQRRIRYDTTESGQSTRVLDGGGDGGGWLSRASRSACAATRLASDALSTASQRSHDG